MYNFDLSFVTRSLFQTQLYLDLVLVICLRAAAVCHVKAQEQQRERGHLAAFVSQIQNHDIRGRFCTPERANALGTGYLPELIIEMGVRIQYIYTHTLSTHFFCQCAHRSNKSVVSGLMSVCFLATPKDVSCMEPTYAYYGFS